MTNDNSAKFPMKNNGLVSAPTHELKITVGFNIASYLSFGKVISSFSNLFLTAILQTSKTK